MALLFNGAFNIHRNICRCCCIIRMQNIQKMLSSSDVKLKIESSGPEKITRDWIGPADSESNIRKYRFFKPAKESIAETELRKLREETHNFNHQFWAKHNRSFFKSKEQFIKETLEALRRQNPHNQPDTLTPEQLSVFYKSFLDSHYQEHKKYNR